MNICDKIIDKIKRNVISTTEVADCLGKSGVIPGVLPLNPRHFVVGKIRWIYAYNESNWDVHKQIRDVQNDEIVYIETFDCADRAVFGDIVAKFILLYKQAQGIVIKGNVRDAHRLIKENWPIWCSGRNPVGCFNRKNECEFDQKLLEEKRAMYDGAIIVCDDTGVVVIPEESINEEFLAKLDWIEEQEDIWYDCVDRKKWDTYDTICLKKYLDNKE